MDKRQTVVYPVKCIANLTGVWPLLQISHDFVRQAAQECVPEAIEIEEQ